MHKLKNRRLVIAHNPHSSRGSEVKELVFDRLDSAGIDYEMIEVRQAHLDDNVARLAPLIRANDIVLSAAGDGSAHAVAHSVMKANQPGVQLGFLAFGNFNDVPNTFNSGASMRDPISFLEKAKEEVVWPLQVSVDGKPLRNALLYVTLGWTARAANRFDDPKLRYKIKNGGAGLVRSIWRLGWYYLKSRRDSLLPPFNYNETAHAKTTDIILANGPTVARLFRSGKHYYRQQVFLYRKLDVRWLLTNIPFLVSGVFGRMKGEEVTEVVLNFETPSDVPIQCDGEVVLLEGISSMEIKKTANSITVLTAK